jgi:hypothetical protein
MTVFLMVYLEQEHFRTCFNSVCGKTCESRGDGIFIPFFLKKIKHLE